jgi:hypothetical protein
LLNVRVRPSRKLRAFLESAQAGHALTPRQQEILEGLLQPLRAAYQGGKLPHNALVQRACAAVRQANDLPGLTEADQLLLDELYGLAKWAGLIYPLTRLDPAMFAAERRAKRAQAPSAILDREWRD